MEKVEHYGIFWENAELNCRLEKRPLPDETDDGSFIGFAIQNLNTVYPHRKAT